jgi:aldehyde dehydrogenase (NAD+)
MTKFANAGQMCVAPDYVLVQTNRKEELIESLKQTIIDFYSNDPATDYNYCKIINEKQFNRLTKYLSNGTVVHGGHYDATKLYIEPTLMENVSAECALMQEEIFGPILPVIPFESFEEAKNIIDQHANPLAFYVYSSSKKKQKRWLDSVPSGGSCINNSSWHFANHYLPLGGRGNSGLGEYHGKNSFETFSHRKAVMKTPTWLDPKIKYPPFKGKLWLFKKVVR